jgi:hypothetical protein
MPNRAAALVELAILLFDCSPKKTVNYSWITGRTSMSEAVLKTASKYTIHTGCNLFSD